MTEAITSPRPPLVHKQGPKSLGRSSKESLRPKAAVRKPNGSPQDGTKHKSKASLVQSQGARPLRGIKNEAGGRKPFRKECRRPRAAVRKVDNHARSNHIAAHGSCGTRPRAKPNGGVLKTSRRPKAAVTKPSKHTHWNQAYVQSPLVQTRGQTQLGVLKKKAGRPE